MSARIPLFTRRAKRRGRAAGFTLVELLVATVAGLDEPSFEAAARATLGCSLLMRG